ncbi:MAG: tetratricopeptide repeat protein [bacterium]|nr:tetratricopeptide repeat protein [bacterium]
MANMLREFSLPSILQRDLSQCSIIILLVLISYFPALFAGFIWDDDAVTDNPLLQNFDGLWKIWFSPKANIPELHYWPVVYTSFWIEYQLWGAHPFGYHLINIVLHAGNVILLWSILKKIEVPGRWFISLIFAFHPVHVESVAWIIERKDVLSGFFYLSSFLAYLNFLTASTQNRRIAGYSLALLLFILALLSKSITVSLPIALLLYLWWKNGRITRVDFIPILPFIAVAIIIVYFDIWFVNQRQSLAVIELSPIQRGYIAGKALWFYLTKLIYPVNLLTVYPRWNLAVGLFTQLVYPLTYLVFLATLYAGKKYIGRGAFASFAFFTVTLAPTLGFISFSYMYHSFVADRFQYLASIGPIILFGSLGYKLYDVTVKTTRKLILRIAGIAIITLLGFLTWKQAERYESDETLFRYTLAKNPASWLACNNLGLALAEKNQFDEAVKYYRKALELKPDFAYPYNNLGILLLKEGKLDQAIPYFNQALARYPTFTEAMNNLGIALALQGKLLEAKQCFQKVLELNPYNTRAQYNLEKAIKELQNRETKEP